MLEAGRNDVAESWQAVMSWRRTFTWSPTTGPDWAAARRPLNRSTLWIASTGRGQRSGRGAGGVATLIRRVEEAFDAVPGGLALTVP